MKKIIYLIIALVFSGCSSFKEEFKQEIIKEGKNAIKEQTNKSIKEIKDTSNAILKETGSNVDSLTKVAQFYLEEQTKKNGKEINEKIIEHAKNIDISIGIGLIASGLSLLLLILGFYCLYKIKQLTDENKVIFEIEKQLNKHIRTSVGNQNDDHKLFLNIVVILEGLKKDKDFIQWLNKYISDYCENMKKKMNNVNHYIQPSINNNIPDQRIITPQKKELYTRENLNNVSENYERGKSYHKLIIDNSNSNFADVDLCIEYDDAKERFFNNYSNEVIRNLCEINKENNNPTDVRVVEFGRAEKNCDSEWKIIKKVKVELK